MEHTQILGDTWVLEGEELIPYYRVDARHCILLDSGLASEREALVTALRAADLTPIGVLGSHAHRDHSGNSFYLQETYGSRLALSEEEAALSTSLLMFQAAYVTDTPKTVALHYHDCVGRVDALVPSGAGSFLFCGVPFEIFPTPGHTPGHIAITTPDRVLYAGDALRAGPSLGAAKLPYHYDHAHARAGMEALRSCRCAACVAAHRGVAHEMGPLVDANLALLNRRDEELLALLPRPMSLDELCLAAFRYHKTLTSKPEKASLYARNLFTQLAYLVDSGRVEETAVEVLRYFRRRD